MSQGSLDLVEEVRSRRAGVLAKIAEAAGRARRSAEDVRLVVVTKGQPVQIIEAAIEAGATILGENYAEEATQKIGALGLSRSKGVEWHMIGHVQSRKAKLVARGFDMVHSVDSLKLARRLDAEARDMGRRLPILLEFNVGGEAAKQGWMAQDDSRWSGLLPEVEAVVSLPDLEVRGLMTMPPLAQNPETTRVHFQALPRLREFLAARIPGAKWEELSMGTSADYEVAVEEGATLVRIGQAILGPRPAREVE